MYPEAGKRSLPNKGMALFRALVGRDADAAEALEVALRVARRRVVVKRPRRAPPLGADAGAPTPSGSVVGTTTRYDLYAPRPPSP
jgi:16S rRNA (guanine1516-N2)-methyltransferase